LHLTLNQRISALFSCFALTFSSCSRHLSRLDMQGWPGKVNSV
jgi:hypothetical protein